MLGQRLSLAVCAATLSAQVWAADEWVQWGGPHGDFTVAATGLAEKWPTGGPVQLWKRPLGDGYSAIVCKGGRLFTAYHLGNDEVVVSLDAANGETKWEHRETPTIWPDMTPEFGLGPNTTPLIMDGRIVAIGIDGRMICLDSSTGNLIWKHDLPAEFGRRKRDEEYGYSGSPIAYKNSMIVPVGGDQHAVVAFDVNGAIVWKSAAGGVSYAGTTMTKIGGQDQFIYFEPEGVVGLDPATGRTLWRSEIPYNNGNHLTPVVKCDDEHLWVSSQFSTGGARLLKIKERSGVWDANQVWFERKLQASHWTMMREGDLIYGSIGGNSTSYFAGFEWRTGKLAWRERGFHKAQCIYADGKMIMLTEDGLLALAKVSPRGLEILGKAQVTESVSWTLPTLAGTKLYVRDRKNIMAFDLSKAVGP